MSCLAPLSQAPVDLCNRNHHGQPDGVELVKEADGVAISSVGGSMRIEDDSKDPNL